MTSSSLSCLLFAVHLLAVPGVHLEIVESGAGGRGRRKSGTLTTGTGAADARSVPAEGTDGQRGPVRCHHTGDGGGVHGGVGRGVAERAGGRLGRAGAAAAAGGAGGVRAGGRAGWGGAGRG